MIPLTQCPSQVARCTTVLSIFRNTCRDKVTNMPKPIMYAIRVHALTDSSQKAWVQKYMNLPTIETSIPAQYIMDRVRRMVIGSLQQTFVFLRFLVSRFDAELRREATGEVVFIISSGGERLLFISISGLLNVMLNRSDRLGVAECGHSDKSGEILP